MEYTEAVKDALQKTGLEMYTNMAAINVPRSAFMEAYKETLHIMFEDVEEMEQMDDCMEDAILSLMLGNEYPKYFMCSL